MTTLGRQAKAAAWDASLLLTELRLPGRPNGTTVAFPRFPVMKVHEEGRNAVLFAAIMTTCAVVAGVSALFEPAMATQEVASRPAYLSDSTPVRIVGVPFIPKHQSA